MKSTRKVLHVGGVGWNAYLNAKLMWESGDVAHVAANDIYHCVCSPEWHELADQGLNRDDLEDDFYPNFFRIAEAHAVRPRWFVQAPQILTIDYLYFLARGETEIADGLWNTLQYNRFKAVLRRTTVPEGVRLTRREFDQALKERQVARVFQPELMEGFGVERLTARFLRAASKVQAMAGYNPPYDPTFVDSVARTDDVLAEMIAAARANRSSVKLGFERARFPPDGPRMDLSHFLGWDEHTRGEQRQGDRCAQVRAEDAVPYSGVVPDWNRLFRHYDHRVLYGGSPIMGLLSQTPHYLAYEHGTIRSLPFEDNAFGRLIHDSYLGADAVFITNGDYVTAKHRLEFEAQKRIYLPHAFDERPLLRFAQVNGLPKRAPGPARFFWPTRQDWTDHGPGSKGNDRLFRAVAQLAERGETNFRITLVSWGPDVEKGKALIRDLGVERFFEWMPPMGRSALWRKYLEADAVIDQFILSSMGGVSFEALTLGKRTITFDDGISNKEFFGVAPPLLAAGTDVEIAARLQEVIDDLDDLAGVGAASTAWMLEYHSGQRFLALQRVQFQRIEALEARDRDWRTRLALSRTVVPIRVLDGYTAFMGTVKAVWQALKTGTAAGADQGGGATFQLLRGAQTAGGTAGGATLRLLRGAQTAGGTAGGTTLRLLRSAQTAGGTAGGTTLRLLRSAQTAGGTAVGAGRTAVVAGAARLHAAGRVAGSTLPPKDRLRFAAEALFVGEAPDPLRPPANATAIGRFEASDVFCNHYWRNAGAQLQLNERGAKVVTPASSWHYAAGVGLDLDAVNLDLQRCWVRIRMTQVRGEIAMAIYDEAKDRVTSQTVVAPRNADMEVIVPVFDTESRLLLLRAGGEDRRVSATIVEGEVLTFPRFKSLLPPAQPEAVA